MGEAACYAHMLDDQGRMPDPPRVRIERLAEVGHIDPSEIRILIERTWPHGVDKDSLVLDGWARQLAPSSELRRWLAHDSRRWPEFQHRFLRELAQNLGELRRLAVLARGGHLILVHSARDEKHNHAVVLKALLEEAAQEGAPIGAILSQHTTASGSPF